MIIEHAALARRFIWRGLFALLALSVACPVVAAFSSGPIDRYRYQLALQCMAVAAAAGLMRLTSWLVEIKRARKTGLFFMLVVLVEFILSLALIWTGIDYFLTAAIILGLIAVVAAASFHTMRQGGDQLALLVGIFLYGGTSIFFRIRVGGYPTDDLHSRLAESIWLLAWFGLVLACCLTGTRKEQRIWRWVGVAIGVEAVSLALHALWAENSVLQASDFWWGMWPSDARIAAFFALAPWASFVAFAHLLRHWSLPQQRMWLRSATMGCASAATILFSWSAVEGANHESIVDIFVRLAWAEAIVALTGGVTVAIISTMGRMQDPSEPSMPIDQLTVICPNCEQYCTAGPGKISCACGLEFAVNVREKRCPKCRYSLLMNRSRRCPECGTAVNG